ncbi:hypothetical protein [Luteolibacter marinus]|uniref:hypothetical protein n=1 Tax=Luteolibacter marinus TaxID=2776705 RepID=UPI00186652D8|nr:hypothetical protein [Luteolibacter marinus]
MKPTLILSCLLTLPAAAGDLMVPDAMEGGWRWSLSAGPSFRSVGSLKINAGYRSSLYDIPSLVGIDTTDIPAIGTIGDYAEREYNDGYVRQDGGTAIDGSTWYWGYDNGGQVQGDRLAFSATGFRSVRSDMGSSRGLGAASRDHLQGIAPHIQLDGVSPHEVGGFQLGFSLGFDFTKVDQTLAFSSLAQTQSRDDYRLDYTDYFDLDGVIPPLAPYGGTVGGPGPLIGNLPSDRVVTETLIGSESAIVSNLANASIDINVVTVTLAPSLSRTFGPLDYSMQAGLILNVYQWDARQNERLTAATSAGKAVLGSWSESNSGTKFRPGLFAQADAAYRIAGDLSLAAYLRFDVASEFRAQAGPTVYKFDPTGMATGFMVRYDFP